jgi:protein TonB
MEEDKSNNDFLNGLAPEIIAGYLKGTLPAEMRQKVEQYLEENPFEAEAIDGFKSYSTDLDQELAALDDQLMNKIRSKPGRPARYVWPAAAAISLLLASGLIIYLLLPVQQETTPVAVIQDSTVFQPKGQAKTAAPDAALKSANRTSKTVDSGITDETTSQQSPVTEQTELPAADVAKPPEQELEPAATVTQEETETIVDDPTEKKVAEETVIEDVVFEEAPAFNSRSGKSATGLSAIAAAPERDQSIALPLAQPPDDWTEYLSRQLRYPDAAKSNGIQGTVKLRFHVDANGNPGGFEFVQKLGYGCDQEALRVIKNGPLWNPAKINGVSVISNAEVVITFPHN